MRDFTTKYGENHPMNFAVPVMISAALLSGCATITRGQNDVLLVNTAPADATVTLSTGEECTGPACSFRLPRRSEIDVTIAHPRCQPQTIHVTHQTASDGSWGMAGNVLVGGIIGLGVDAATGASQDLVPNPVNATLECR